jgi:4-coumarate--CoA ligase
VTKHRLRSSLKLKLTVNLAAPLDKSLQARVQEVLPKGSPFTQVFGMTETTCVITNVPYPGEDTSGSVGFPLLNTDIKIIDEAGNDVTHTGARGELSLRGPTVTRGYFQNPEANRREWDADGFFKSGDIAYRDTETGRLFIVDRKKVRIDSLFLHGFPPTLLPTALIPFDKVSQVTS